MTDPAELRLRTNEAASAEARRLTADAGLSAAEAAEAFRLAEPWSVCVWTYGTERPEPPADPIGWHVPPRGTIHRRGAELEIRLRRLGRALRGAIG